MCFFWCSMLNMHTFAPKVPKNVALDTWYECVWNTQCHKICVLGVARQTHIPAHQKCHQKCVLIPGMGVFQMHNAQKCTLLVWRAEHTYLCTRNDNKSVFAWLVWVCVKCTLPYNMCFWCGAWNTHISVPEIPPKISLDTEYGCVWNAQCKNVRLWCGGPNAHTSKSEMPTKCRCIPSMGVFEIQNAVKYMFLVCCTKRTYLCIRNANKTLFGYLVWVSVPKNGCFSCGTLNAHTSAPETPTQLSLDT